MALIDPSHFPTIDTSTIEPAESALKKWGADLLDDVQDLRTEWRKLWLCYHAPEQGRVYALQDPAVTSAQDVKADFDAAAAALATYASALDGIKPDLDALRGEAETFRAEALQGYEEHYTPPVMAFGVIGGPERLLEMAGVIDKRHVDWEDHKPAVNKNNDLLMRLDAILGRINRAENDCAETLLGIAGDNSGMCLQTPEDLPAGAFVGTDAEGNGMPWGSVGAYQPSNCGDGAYWAANEFVVGFGALVGISSDYDGYHWGFDTVGNAWGGLFNVAGSMAFVSNPMGLALVYGGMFGIDNPLTDFAEDRMDVVGSFAAGFVGLDYMGAKAAADSGENAWDALTVNYRNDPGGATTMSVLNVASLFLPTKSLGAAGRGAAASRLLRLGEAVGLDTRLGATLGGGARLLEGGLRLSDVAGAFERSGIANMLRIGDDAVRLGDDAVRLGDDAPTVTSQAPLTFNNSTYPKQFLDQIQMGTDGKMHHPGDPPGTFRTSNGMLHDGTRLVSDPPLANFNANITGPIETPSLSAPTKVEIASSAAADVTNAVDSSASAKAARADLEAALRAKLDSMGLTDVKVSELKLSNLDQHVGITGTSTRDLHAIRNMVEELSTAKGTVTASGEAVGVTGGQAAAESVGVSIYDKSSSFPGANRVDDVGVRNGNVAVMEYKGMSAELSRNPVTLSDGRRALQGSSAYVADRMVRDPKVASMFADNPELWAKVKSGQSSIEYYVFQTKPGGSVTMRTSAVSLADLDIAAMERAIQAVS